MHAAIGRTLALACVLWAGAAADAQVIGVRLNPERDFRALQSPVKNQRGRGTCTAFAITAALETFPGVPHDLSEQSIHGLAKFEQVRASRIAYLLSRDGKVLESLDADGLPSFEPYAQVLREYGVTRESVLPYNPDGVVVSEALRRALPSAAADALARVVYRRGQMTRALRDRMAAIAKYRVPQVEFVPFATLRTIANPAKRLAALDASTERLKRWLRTPAYGHQAIPIAYVMHNELWGRYAYADETPVFTLAPMLAKAAEERTRRAAAKDTAAVPSQFGQHAVTIVGYTENIRRFVPTVADADAKQGYWIVKNSWGPHWGGAGGYGFIGLDYHRACASQAMLIGRVEIDFRKIAVDLSGLMIQPGAEAKTPERILHTFTSADIHLKVQPSAFWRIVSQKGLLIGARRSVTLSTSVDEAVEPDIRGVRYRIVYREGEVAPDGSIAWSPRRAVTSPLITGGIGANDRPRDHAFAWTVSDAALSDVAKRFGARRHRGHLDLRILAAYYGTKVGGGLEVRTGRFFATRYDGGVIGARDLGEDAAGRIDARLAARLFAADR